MKFAKVIFGIVYGGFILACGYVSGYATCMHQHADAAEADKILRDENGEISYGKYIKEAFKDYKRMQNDPLKLKKT